MRKLGDQFPSDPGSDLTEPMAQLANQIRDHVTALSAKFPANAYPGNVFKNQSRVSSLVTQAGLL